MGDSEQTRQRNFVDPPLAGHVTAIALVASTAATFDLSTMDNQVVDPTGSDTLDTGADNAFVTFVVDGVVPVYVVFGASVAAVSGGNAPVIATTGTNAAGVCYPLYPTSATGPASSVDANRFRIRKGYNSVIGFISSGTPTLRIYKSSPYRQAC